MNQIPEAKANELFDLIDKFAGYGFNKSHAAAYALLAYQTAWLKAHYPDEFYAASMCFDMHQTDKLAIFVDDMRRHGRRLPAAGDQRQRGRVRGRADRATAMAVRYALGALKGVGEKAMEQLVDERDAQRAVRQPRRFRRPGRSAPAQPAPARKPRRRRRVRRHRAERAGVFAAAETILAVAASAAERADERAGRPVRRERGQRRADPDADRGDSWTLAERMAAEKESFGFYFSAHPVDAYRHLAEAHGARTLRRARRACRRRPTAAAAGA